jgi:hypothetical protein
LLAVPLVAPGLVEEQLCQLVCQPPAHVGTLHSRQRARPGDIEETAYQVGR